MIKKQSLRDWWDSTRWSNIHVIGEERKKGEKIGKYLKK